jgi:hypothetical protein
MIINLKRTIQQGAQTEQSLVIRWIGLYAWYWEKATVNGVISTDKQCKNSKSQCAPLRPRKLSCKRPHRDLEMNINLKRQKPRPIHR